MHFLASGPYWSIGISNGTKIRGECCWEGSRTVLETTVPRPLHILLLVKEISRLRRVTGRRCDRSLVTLRIDANLRQGSSTSMLTATLVYTLENRESSRKRARVPRTRDAPFSRTNAGRWTILGVFRRRPVMGYQRWRQDERSRLHQWGTRTAYGFFPSYFFRCTSCRLIFLSPLPYVFFRHDMCFRYLNHGVRSILDWRSRIAD